MFNSPQRRKVRRGCNKGKGNSSPPPLTPPTRGGEYSFLRVLCDSVVNYYIYCLLQFSLLYQRHCASETNGVVFVYRFVIIAIRATDVHNARTIPRTAPQYLTAAQC